MTWRSDNRGLTMSFVQLLASLGVGAAVIYVIYSTGDPLLADAAAAAPGGMGGMNMNNWFDDFLLIVPFIFLLVSFFGFITRAVYERGGAR